MPEGDYAMRLDSGLWRDILRVLKQLPQKVADQVVRPAAKKALQPILSTARSILKTRSTTGLLASSLGVVQRANRRRGTVYSIVGPMTGFKDPATGENPANIAHLVEFGTKPHLIAPKGQSGALKIKRGVGPAVYVEGAVRHPGARAKPFMRPAYDTKGREVVKIVEQEIGKSIMRRVKRFEKKGKP